MLPFTLTLLLMMLTVACVLWVRKRRDAQRRSEREQLARSLGLEFFANDPFGLQNQLRDFELFKSPLSGRPRFTGRIRNVLRGKVDDTPVCMFDYTYSVQAGNSRKRITQTVFFADNKNWYLPPFRLRPETWWHKVLDAVGARGGLRLDQNAEFNERFVLTGEFEGLVRQTFAPDVQELLLEQPPLHLDGNNYYLLAYKPHKHLDNERARAFWERCCALTRALGREDKLELLRLAEPLPVPAAAEKQPDRL